MTQLRLNASNQNSYMHMDITISVPTCIANEYNVLIIVVNETIWYSPTGYSTDAMAMKFFLDTILLLYINDLLCDSNFTDLSAGLSGELVEFLVLFVVTIFI